jgi:uncharacterized protein (DUF1697 family)
VAANYGRIGDMAKKSAAARYIAFLRGINVGGHRVKMDQLRELFEGLKFANVSTFIASGNVIFESPVPDVAQIEQRIEERLKRSLGYEVCTFVRTPADLAVIAALCPFAAEDVQTPGHSLYVAFLREAPGPEAVRKLLAFRTPTDDFHAAGREFYWLCRGRFSDSPVSWPQVAKAMAMPSTMRNVTTIRKLAALHAPGAEGPGGSA